MHTSRRDQDQTGCKQGVVLDAGGAELTDMGTRPTVLPMNTGDNLPWMREPKEPFPMKKEFIAPQLEECRKYMLNMTCAVAVSHGLTYHARATKRGKLWVCVRGHGSVQETHRVQLHGGPGGGHHEKGAVKGVGPLPDKYWVAAGISSFRKPRQDSTRRFLKA